MHRCKSTNPHVRSDAAMPPAHPAVSHPMHIAQPAHRPQHPLHHASHYTIIDTQSAMRAPGLKSHTDTGVHCMVRPQIQGDSQVRVNHRSCIQLVTGAIVTNTAYFLNRLPSAACHTSSSLQTSHNPRSQISSTRSHGPQIRSRETVRSHAMVDHHIAACVTSLATRSPSYSSHICLCA